MQYVYTFRARDGSGTGASSMPDGANLPGGAAAYIQQAKLDPAEMVEGSGVVGVGNAAEILAEVRRVGFFYAKDEGTHYNPPRGG